MAVIADEVRSTRTVHPHVLNNTYSGPKRYDYVPETDQWVYSREKQALGELLNTELSKIFGRNIDLKINKVSDCL